MRFSFLLDFYGKLLTDKQRKCCEMYLFEDLSIVEIGEELGISRQAVYDMLHRSQQILAAYERKLGLVSRYKVVTKVLNDVCARVALLETKENSGQVAAILKQIKPFLDDQGA